MGSVNIDNTGGGGDVTLSSDGTDLLLNGTAIGGAALELYAENPSSPTAPSATGTNAVAIGTGAVASGTNSTALGLANAGGLNSFAAVVGDASGTYGAQGTGSISIGTLSKATIIAGTAVGYGATSTHQASSAFGYAATTTANNQIALGGSGITARISGAYTLPTTDGTNGQVLTTNGAGVATFADAGGGGSPDLFAESYDGTSGLPVATGSTNAVAIGRAYASGTDSFAAAIANNTSTYGATGANSIAMGYLAKAAGAGSISIGAKATNTARNTIAIGGTIYGGPSVTGDCAVVIGQNYALSNPSAAGPGSISLQDGSSTTSAAASSMAVLGGKAIVKGQYAYAGGEGGGTAQTSTYVLKRGTTDATATVLVTDRIIDTGSTPGTSNQIVLWNNSAVTFSGNVAVREQGSAGSDYAGWEVKGVIMRGSTAGTTSLGVAIVNNLYHTAALANASIALTADTTNGCLKLEVTGIAATNLRWAATINTSEVSY